jgi:short-subunit dehydrogenase
MIIIVGASRGLGKSIATIFREKELLLISRSGIETSNKNHFNINSDINNLNYGLIKKDHGGKKIEAIFFTAGLSKINDNFNLSDKEKDEIVNTNFLSITKICEFFLNNFTFEDSSLICFCSSISTFQPRNKQVLYSSAKSSLNSYITSLKYNLNYNQKKIRIANLVLGFLNTEMNKDIKTLLPKKNPSDVALYLNKNLNLLDGTYYIPKYWFIIKIILILLPEKIKLILFNKYKI